MKKAAFILLLAIIVSLPCPAQAQSPQQTLNQYVADLQKNPNDYALREKIIRHVQAMKQKPAIPEEAERYMARGSAAVKGAKNEKDFRDAAAEFEKASLASPWLPAAYYNLGITQDKAGKYREAIQSLKLYLLAAPDASDAKAVKNLVYEIEYRQEKAAKESTPAAIAVQEQKKFAELLKKMDGRQYKAPPVPPYRLVVDVQGKKFVFGRYFMDNPDPWRYPHCNYIPIQGRVSTCSYQDNLLGFTEYTHTISEDGSRITSHIRYQGKVSETVYLWP